MNQRLTIFHTDAGLNFGGQELRTLEEVKRLNELGHRAWAIVSPGGAMLEEARRRGVPHFAVSMHGSFDPRGLAKMAWLVFRHRPDVICAHGSHDFYAAYPARLLGVPVLRYRHISDPVQSTFARNFAYKHGASLVV